MVIFCLVVSSIAFWANAVEIQAHRGSRFKQPENTIAAFKQAIADGADSIECDVQVSSDNRVFLAHDSVLDGESIKSVSYNDVLVLGCGKGIFQLYPLLKDVLSIFKDQIIFDIEIKCDNDTWEPACLVEAVVAVIHDSGCKSIRLRSFDDRVIRYAKEKYSNISCALLTDVGEVGCIEKALNVGAQIIAPHDSSVIKDIINDAHDAGLKIIPWTINDVERALKLMAAGIDGITTDYPDRLSVFLVGVELDEL